MPCTKAFRILKLASDLCWLEGKVGSPAQIPRMLDDLQGIRPLRFVGQNNNDLACGNRG